MGSRFLLLVSKTLRQSVIARWGSRTAASPVVAAAPVDHKATPTIAQYLKLKAEHPNYILLFRMGDFYEMFFEDAVIASQAVDIAVRLCRLRTLMFSFNAS